MAIVAAHTLVYTPEAEAVRAVFRDVLGWPHVDAGHGWLIFRLPPAEVGVHPSEGATHHELSFVCDDLAKTLDELRGKPGVEILGPPEDHGYGMVTFLGLPGGLKVQIYEPRHPLAATLPG